MPGSSADPAAVATSRCRTSATAACAWRASAPRSSWQHWRRASDRRRSPAKATPGAGGSNPMAGPASTRGCYAWSWLNMAILTANGHRCVVVERCCCNAVTYANIRTPRKCLHTNKWFVTTESAMIVAYFQDMATMTWRPSVCKNTTPNVREQEWLIILNGAPHCLVKNLTVVNSTIYHRCPNSK